MPINSLHWLLYRNSKIFYICTVWLFFFLLFSCFSISIWDFFYLFQLHSCLLTMILVLLPYSLQFLRKFLIHFLKCWVGQLLQLQSNCNPAEICMKSHERQQQNQMLYSSYNLLSWKRLFTNCTVVHFHALKRK